MDKATTASILGTILGLAAGVIGMLLFGQRDASMVNEEQVSSLTRERDTAQTDRDGLKRQLDEEVARRELSDKASIEMADELERLAADKGAETSRANEWKEKYDALKAASDEEQRQQRARIGKLEGILEENGILEFLTDEQIAERVTGLKSNFETAFAGKDKKAAMQAIWDMQKLGPKAYDEVIDLWQKMADDYGLEPWGEGDGTMGLTMQEFISLVSKFDLIEYGLTAQDGNANFRVNSLYGLPWWANEDAGKRAKLAGDTLGRAQGYEAQAAVDALKNIADPSTARYLTDYLASNTDNPKARIDAINALAQKNTDGGWAAIKDAAENDPDPDVKAAAQAAQYQKDVKVAGVLVTQVLDNYQAAIAGIKKGDILTHYNGERIKTMAELATAKSKVAEGQSVQVVVDRAGKEVTLTLGSGMIGINGINVAPKE